MKKSTIAIIAVVVVLLVVSIVFAGLNRSTIEESDGTTVAVEVAGEIIATYTIDDMKAMEGVETIHKYIKSGSREDEDSDFTGIEVRDLILAADPTALDNAKTITAVSGDGYASSYDIDEVMEDSNIMLIYEQDGAALIPYSEGGTGPLRIVVMADAFGSRSSFWITKLVVE